ncbi:MAG TPA: TIGR03089 family protein, partial [Actinomycetes bacterium]|nr:TIGR03089 family protein [Actinomycetes bacterium]
MNLWEAAPARHGDKPFLTWYDADRGERVELSYRTFDNWVAKTANLLVDELGAAPGDRVGALLVDHWQTPIVLAACWRAGTSVVALDPEGAADGLVAAFVREELLAGAASALAGTPVVALTADLLGRGTADLGGALSFARVVPTMGDLFEAGPDPAGEALVTGEGAATMAGLLERAAALAARTGLTDADRMLSGRRLLSVDGAVAGLLAPFTAGAGVVLGRDLAPGRFWKRVADERVTVAALGPAQAAAVSDAGPPPPDLASSPLRVLLD